MSEDEDISNEVNTKTESGTEEKTPFLQANKKTIYFNENWDVGIGGGLWSNGLSLSKFFIEHSDLLRRNLRRLIAEKKGKCNLKNHKLGGIKAIELGSGNGLLSCCLAAVVGDLLDTLYVTDLSDHIDLMKQTVLANSHILALQSNGEVKESDDDDEYIKNSGYESVIDNDVKCHVIEHAWGKFKSSDPLSGKFDFIFGSDVAYRDFLHEPLISSLLQFSDDHTISIIGVTMTDTKPIFFQSLREAGFQYERIPDHIMSQEFRGTTFGLFVIQKNKNGTTN